MGSVIRDIQGDAVPDFIRASRLYDVEKGEQILWDWRRNQPARSRETGGEHGDNDEWGA